MKYYKMTSVAGIFKDNFRFMNFLEVPCPCMRGKDSFR
jgi:hypothetical protein